VRLPARLIAPRLAIGKPALPARAVHILGASESRINRNRRRRRRAAWTAPVAAAGTVIGLQPVLNPFNGEIVRQAKVSFPRGHASPAGTVVSPNTFGDKSGRAIRHLGAP
jgi:hypothetical protein